MPTLPRIAWFSPLNTKNVPSSSVSAYFTDEIVPALKKRYEIEVFYDGFEQYKDLPTHHYLLAFEKHRINPYDFFFYQVEDRSCSNFVRAHLGIMPGVVLFHDFLYTQPGPPPFWQSSWEDTVQKFNKSEATWAARDKLYEFKGPRAYREGAMALVALFSSQRDRIDFLRHVEISLNPKLRANSYYLPFPVAKLEVEQRAFSGTICYTGSTQIEHRAHKLLEALALLEEPYNLLWVIDTQEKARAQELLREFEISNATLIDSRSPHKWREVVARSDLAVHTLFSCYGQPAPYLSISLAAGLPCIVTNFGEADFLPQDLVFKVDMGAGETRALATTLSALLKGDMVAPLKASQEFSRSIYGLDQVSQALSNVLERSREDISKFMKAWSVVEQQARAEVMAQISNNFADPLGSKDIKANFAWDKLGQAAFNELGWN